jgi:tRNA threonylcarbamoyladenosine modification (KEOPS) complex  Pcc1 subunit
MSRAPGPWTGRLRIELANAPRADRLARALAPEASREVPRARSAVARRGPRTVEIVVRARDTGALRAAVNTFLGWVQLEADTARVAERRGDPEALI